MSDLVAPPEPPPQPPPSKLRRALLLGLAGVLVALFGVVVVPRWLKQRADDREWAQAVLVEQTNANPGTLQLDPALPGGIVVVTLVPAVTGIVLTEPATIRVDNRSFEWTPEARGRFHELVAARPYPITIAGPYATEPLEVTLPNGSSGARIAVRAIPLDPLQIFGVDTEVNVTPEKRMEVDMTRPETFEVRWLQGVTVVSVVNLPRAATVSASGRPAYPALADRVGLEWKMQGGHRDPSDRRFDRAIVRALPGTPFDELFAVTGAVLATTREISREGVLQAVPAFKVSVQPPPPPPPPASPEAVEPEPRSVNDRVRISGLSVSGRLPPEVVTRILRQRMGRVRQCYEVGLAANPTLAGRMSVRFVIGADGAVSRASNAGSSSAYSSSALAEPLTRCIVHAIDGLAFPRPEGGIVSVVAPFFLSPVSNHR